MKKSIVMLFLFFGALLTFLLGSHYAKDVRARIRLIGMNRAFDQVNRPFSITVKVTDEKGVPIQGVKTKTMTFVFTGKPNDGKREDGVINGVYHFENRHCSGITVDFSHPDYHPDRLIFDSSNSRLDMKVINNVRTFDTNLAMKRMGKEGRMVRFTAGLSWHPENGGVVYDIKPNWEMGPVGQRNELKTKIDLADLTAVPRIFIDVAPSKTPRPSIVNKRVGKLVSPENKDVYLVLDDKTNDCGFVVFNSEKVIDTALKSKVSFSKEQEEKFKKGIINERAWRISLEKEKLDNRLYREMELAPEKGYQKRIKIPDELWLEQYPYVFYFKLMGRYGKGSLISLDYDDRDHSVSMYLEFYMELDGTRNVTMREDPLVH